MKKACIFDLDGTLLNTLPTIAALMNRALTAHGFAPYPEEAYRRFVGNGARSLVKRALNAQGALSPDAVEQVFAFFSPIYENEGYDGTAPYEGVLPLLHTLCERGVQVCVLSNKPDAATRNVVSHFFPDVPFAAVHGGREDVPLKPAPDGVWQILEEIGAEKEDCLFVGDSNVDMETARASGLFGIGVEWGFRTREELVESGADATVSVPEQILSYFI